MAIELFELVGKDDRRFSPYCWRARMALAHKGLDAAIIPCKFTDKEKIAFSGQERFPVIRDGGTVVSDSWAIACHLEDAYPDRPTLFGGAMGRGLACFLNSWTDRELHLSMIRLVVKDIHDHTHPDDRAYFRATREKRLGGTLEDIQSRRDELRPAFDKALETLRGVLRDQPFLCGEAPAYGDYIVFGAFQWARGVSPYTLLEDGDAVYGWRERMLDLHGALARSVTAYDG